MERLIIFLRILFATPLTVLIAELITKSNLNKDINNNDNCDGLDTDYALK
jgi:hypothetical protein